MPYPPLLKLASSTEYRMHFENTYCRHPTTAFDGIAVRFRKRQFNHCFFESSRRDKNKDLFSAERAERMDWIKVALQDPQAELHQGYDKKRKQYDPGRRVAVVQHNYVVVIRFTGDKEAEFVTAYVAGEDPEPGQNFSTLEKIRMSPKWA